MTSEVVVRRSWVVGVVDVAAISRSLKLDMRVTDSSGTHRNDHHSCPNVMPKVVDDRSMD
jgi:hypothetical protein